MAGNHRGIAGCGCLVFLVIICIVGAGVLMHPFTLRLLGGQLSYSDTIVPGDIIFVPRFEEDKNGELYLDAFRDYWAGIGKSILIVDDKVLGVSVRDIVARMAKERGIREDAIRKVEAEGDGAGLAFAVKKGLAALGAKKVVLLVPEYASRRFHLLYGSGSQNSMFLIKAVNVSYFKKDKWWRDGQSRHLMVAEVYAIVSLYVDRFKRGEKEDHGKE
jgi:hypothetical protein